MVWRTRQRPAGRIPVRIETYPVQAATSPVAAFLVAPTVFGIAELFRPTDLKLRAHFASSTLIDANTFFDRQKTFTDEEYGFGEISKIMPEAFFAPEEQTHLFQKESNPRDIDSKRN